MALLVSIPSVSTMIALLPPDRAASRRAAAAVASYKEVVPNGSKSDSPSFRVGRSRVKSWRSWSAESKVKSPTSSWPGRSCDRSESYAWRAMAILGPMRMLPLMSTRIARLSGDWRSERSDRIGRSWPLSRISKSVVVRPLNTRPRASRTDAWMVTTSTALRKVCCCDNTASWADGDTVTNPMERPAATQNSRRRALIMAYYLPMYRAQAGLRLGALPGAEKNCRGTDSWYHRRLSPADRNDGIHPNERNRHDCRFRNWKGLQATCGIIDGSSPEVFP